MSELDTFAVVELMGHRRTVGRVTEATIAGGEFIRVDATPLGVEQEGPTVMFYRPAAIYSITPVTEEVARREASGTDVRPDWWWKHVRPSVCAISGPSDDDDGYEDTPDVSAARPPSVQLREDVLLHLWPYPDAERAELRDLDYGGVVRVVHDTR